MSANVTKKTQYVELPVTSILEVEGFNMRSEGFEAASGDEKHGFADLVQSIKDRGQDDPIEVVPLDGDNKGKYAVVSGTRRFRAILKLISEGITMPPVKALVLTDRDQSSLYERNLVENLAREDVTAADTAFALGRLKSSRKQDGTFKSDLDLAVRAGIPQSYCSKLLTIAERLHPEVFKFWRAAKNPLPYNTVYEIAKLPPDKHKEEYEKKQDQKASSKGKPGPKDPLDKAKGRLKKLADDLFLLATLGAINCDRLDMSEIILDVCPDLEDQKGKKGKKIVDAAVKFFNDHWAELLARDGVSNEEEEEEDEAPARGRKRSN